MEHFTRKEMRGLEIVKTVESAQIKQLPNGWQTTLRGKDEAGEVAKETFPLRASKYLAERDVPPGVTIEETSD